MLDERWNRSTRSAETTVPISLVKYDTFTPLYLTPNLTANPLIMAEISRIVHGITSYTFVVSITSYD